MGEETFGWEMEEEILEETFASLFLRVEELEEGVDLPQKIRQCTRYFERQSATHRRNADTISRTALKSLTQVNTLGSNRHISVSPGKSWCQSARRWSVAGFESVDLNSIMSTSRRTTKGKAPMSNIDAQTAPSDETQRLTHIRFGLDGMEEYYTSFKEKRSIHAETQFDVESFKIDFSNIYYHIGMQDWGPFTIHIDPYFPELVCTKAQEHESQILKLAKAIPSMIQQAIKKAMQPARNKLRGLCATVEILENEVIALRKDMATLTRPPPVGDPTPPRLAAMTSKPEAPKSPPDD
ncbi:hypothetical protein HAX54_043002 [Datura stramonium]|uniref:Uncharacterized protein n=1 Tax=Datura stramonium TaxID=4076 RepID=A0ABS8SMU1_DATST|nr:hypothetical protein [Datura stramonium]